MMKPTDMQSLELAKSLDLGDPMSAFRSRFHIPRAGDRDCVYLCGNSLGLQPVATRGEIEQELDDWARLGVEGHFHAKHPWFPAHEEIREHLAGVVGAKPIEVVAMNSLTVNLHLLMVSFYRPTKERYKILIEDSAFPSDSYAVASQARFHGLEPAHAVVRLKPRTGEHALRTEDVCDAIDRDPAIALVMLGGVNYLSGQWFNMIRITAHAKSRGCVVGWDLAHAVGNVPLHLSAWGVDFAAWCSYKYLNSGPGSLAGAFVHERHARALDLPRFAGWWGNDPRERFKMGPEFVPVAGADGWQLSNPPIFALAPLRASLRIFAEAGIDRLREKSVKLTGFMEQLIRARCPGVRVVTPADASARGCQLSLVVPGSSRDVQRKLADRGVIVDFREPDVIRAAPVPLYNRFEDVHRFVVELSGLTGGNS